MEIAIVIGLVVAFFYFRFSPDKFASAVRSNFRGARDRVADSIDDAVNQIESAKAAARQQKAALNEGLLNIKTIKNGLLRQVDEEQAFVDKYTAGAEKAAKAGDRGLVEEVVAEKSRHEALLASLKSQLSGVQTQEQSVDAKSVKLDKFIAMLEAKRNEVKTQATTAQLTINIDSMMSAVDLSGSESNLHRADELLNNLKDKAAAVSQMADKAQGSDDLDARLARLTATDDTTSEVDRLMAKHAPASASSNGSSGPAIASETEPTRLVKPDNG